MHEEFIIEDIKPVVNAFDTKLMASGTPGLAREFIWRGQKVTVTDTLRTWKTTGPCRHGSGDQYVRRHWFEVKTAGHGTMKIYFNKGTLGRKKEMGLRIYSLVNDHS